MLLVPLRRMSPKACDRKEQVGHSRKTKQQAAYGIVVSYYAIIVVSYSIIVYTPFFTTRDVILSYYYTRTTDSVPRRQKTISRSMPFGAA